MQVNVNKVWLTVSSVLLGFSFVFSTSIRTTFESVVFLFVVHPYDVGDTLLLTDPNDTASGQQYCQVRRIQASFQASCQRSACGPLSGVGATLLPTHPNDHRHQQAQPL